MVLRVFRVFNSRLWNCQRGLLNSRLLRNPKRSCLLNPRLSSVKPQSSLNSMVGYAVFLVLNPHPQKIHLYVCYRDAHLIPLVTHSTGSTPRSHATKPRRQTPRSLPELRSQLWTGKMPSSVPRGTTRPSAWGSERCAGTRHRGRRSAHW